MPANKKYLTSSLWQRWMKITAGFFGGYAVMISFFLMLTCFFEKKNVIVTGIVAGYVVWALLLLFAFLSKSWWRPWITYLVLTLFFLIPYWLK